MNARVPMNLLESVSTEQLPIPIEQLVQEAYAGSAPEAQNHILARLVGKTFETAPVTTQARLLEQLLQPVGMLPLIAVANGLFARLRFRAGWSHPAIRQSDLVSVRSGDVATLAEQLLQMRSDALIGLIPLLVNAAAQSGSRVASTLATLLHQRAPRRRASDRMAFGAGSLCAS